MKWVNSRDLCVYPWGELSQAESDGTNAILSEIQGSAKEHLQDQGLLSQDREHKVNFILPRKRTWQLQTNSQPSQAPSSAATSHSVSVGVFQVKIQCRQQNKYFLYFSTIIKIPCRIVFSGKEVWNQKKLHLS